MTLAPFAIMSDSDRMLENEVWTEEEQSEIISYVAIDYDTLVSYQLQKAEIQEGCCFELVNLCNPWRWEDKEVDARATHLAVSQHNVMYLKEKRSMHVLNPCPPCLCCVPARYRDDYDPKIRKLIPIEKITDIEVHEAGSNELIEPGCQCPPACNPISIEVPISQAFINTAGSQGSELIIEGIEDANGFRRLVMDLKRGKGGGPSAAPNQLSMDPSTIGNSGEVVSLLQNIANSNREIVNLLKKA